MDRRTITFLSIFIIAVIFLGFGLTWIARASAGPHGGYTPDTDACAGCHRAHTAGYTRLLIGDQDTCSCHSGGISGGGSGSVAALAETDAAVATAISEAGFAPAISEAGAAPSTPNAGVVPTAAGSGSGRIVSTHGNIDFPGRVEDPFELTCVQCHEPHGKTGNLYLVREALLLSPTGEIEVGPVVFQSAAGVKSNDDGISIPTSRICVTCHTNRNNPGYPMVYHSGGANHLDGADYSGQDCTTCHPHDADGDPVTLDGFMAGSGSCIGCHSQPRDRAGVGPDGGRRAVTPEFGAITGATQIASHHVVDAAGSITASAVADDDCRVCHATEFIGGNHTDGYLQLTDPDNPDLTYVELTPGAFRPENITLTDSKILQPFCLNCHDSNGANGDTTPFSDGMPVPVISSTAWSLSVHSTGGMDAINGGYGCLGDGLTSGCHTAGHGSASEKLLSQVDENGAAISGGGAISAATGQTINETCLNCHTDDKVMNKALSGTADDIEEAFSRLFKHDVGSNFTVNGNTYTLQCTTCHNPHVVTGKHWQTGLPGVSPVTLPDLTADPVTNPRAVGTAIWGDEAGEKMNDYAALGAGTGGWYYNVARGVAGGADETVLLTSRPAVYQPPKTGSGYSFEFNGDTLPNYTVFCLGCHDQAALPYQIDDWDSDMHGLGAANAPAYLVDPGTVGSNGNPDPIFGTPDATSGRDFGVWMEWPYESVERNAGINYVLACTDCHETHGSNIRGLLRKTINNSPGSADHQTLCDNCHQFDNSPDHPATGSCGDGGCHGATSDNPNKNSIHGMGERGGGPDKHLWSAPNRPDTTPEIAGVVGYAGSNRLDVTLTGGVYSNKDGTGALNPEDFVLTDVNGNNPKTILSVAHTPGDSVATILMSAALSKSDIRRDLLAIEGISVWDADGDPAGPWPVTISSCPTGVASLEFNESSASATVADKEGALIGQVNNLDGSFVLGNGYFTGDGVDNYITFENNDACLQAGTTLAIKMRLKPTGIPTDTTDYETRILDRGADANYRVSLWRKNSWDTYNAPLTATSIALQVKPTTVLTGEAAWKPILTDYSLCPIVSDHWYQVSIEWDSAREGVLPGSIFVDDQGPDGNDGGERWSGAINCINFSQTLVLTGSRLYAGDRIQAGHSDFVVGANVDDHSANVFEGLIDWIRLGDRQSFDDSSDFPGKQPKSSISFYLPLILKGAASDESAPISNQQSSGANTLYLPVVIKDHD